MVEKIAETTAGVGSSVIKSGTPMNNEIENSTIEIDPEAVVWHVIHVRPRCEKKLAEYCTATTIENYLPLRYERKVYQRRKVEVSKPLFPGYVFSGFNANQRVHILKSGHIVRLIKVTDPVRFLRELDQIRAALSANPGLTACPALERGMRVRILSGPLQGVEGMVASLKGETRVVLNVEMIGQGAAVEVGPEMLERL